jgi:hypothetical protein
MTINLGALAAGLKKMLSVEPQVPPMLRAVALRPSPAKPAPPMLASGRPQLPLTAQVDALVRRKRQARPRA